MLAEKTATTQCSSTLRDENSACTSITINIEYNFKREEFESQSLDCELVVGDRVKVNSLRKQIRHLGEVRHVADQGATVEVDGKLV